MKRSKDNPGSSLNKTRKLSQELGAQSDLSQLLILLQDCECSFQDGKFQGDFQSFILYLTRLGYSFMISSKIEGKLLTNPSLKGKLKKALRRAFELEDFTPLLIPLE